MFCLPNEELEFSPKTNDLLERFLPFYPEVYITFIICLIWFLFRPIFQVIGMEIKELSEIYLSVIFGTLWVGMLYMTYNNFLLKRRPKNLAERLDKVDDVPENPETILRKAGIFDEINKRGIIDITLVLLNFILLFVIFIFSDYFSNSVFGLLFVLVHVVSFLSMGNSFCSRIFLENMIIKILK